MEPNPQASLKAEEGSVPLPSSGPKDEDNNNNNTNTNQKGPIVAIIIGMAGSGKTTLLQVRMFVCIRSSFHPTIDAWTSSPFLLLQRINTYLFEKQTPGYIINLDPAVKNLPYGANIDIRDTVKYKEVMKQ